MVTREEIDKLPLKGIYAPRVKNYIDEVLNGKKPHGILDYKAVNRFIRMLKDDKYEIRTSEADEVLLVGETIFKFVDGEDESGASLVDKKFRWLDWQIFDIYACFIFYHKGTDKRVVTEAYIQIARKNGKSTYVDAIALSYAIKEMKNGGVPIGIVSAKLKYATNLYEILEKNIVNWYSKSKLMAQRDGWKLNNNNSEKRAYNGNFQPSPGKDDGGIIDIEVFAASNDGIHSLRKKMVIIDELHLMKYGATVHSQMKKSTANYANGLTFTITTAAIDKRNYCYNYTEICKKILMDERTDRDYLYIRINKADEDEDGEVDYMNPDEWYKANPSLGDALPVDVLRKDALDASEDSELRLQFLAYSLNCFQNKVSSYFNPSKFILSDMNYDWSVKELLDLNLTWYGGVDLSLYNDLTAAVLLAEHGDITIIIPMSWAPRGEIETKTRKQNMDLFRWEEDGEFRFNDGDTNDPMKVVEWFKEMRDMGFNIDEIGMDVRFGQEFYFEMIREGFKMLKEKQYTWNKSEGFRYLEAKAIDEKLYFMHSGSFEYCVGNVLAKEKSGGIIDYEKVDNNSKIDVFDAAVMAAVRKIKNKEKEKDNQAFEEYLARQLGYDDYT